MIAYAGGDLIKSSLCSIWVKALKLWLSEPSCYWALSSPSSEDSISHEQFQEPDFMVFSVSAYLCLLMKAHQFRSASTPVLEFK